MKKENFRLFALFLLLPALLCGCKKGSAAPQNVVVKAQVTYRRGTALLERTYEHPDKLRKLLMCLRLQEFRGRPEIDPETVAGDSCRILLTYCDGGKAVILEKANRYRCRDFGLWEKIGEEDSLYPLLLAMPGDLSQT